MASDVTRHVRRERARHTDQGLERKQQLLDAAEALFASRGYGPTRIADICEAAGVAKGLFYWYFENKEALFAELVRSVRQQLRRAQAAAMDPDADPVTRLRQGTEASVRFMAEHVPLLRAARGRAQRPAGRPPCCGRAATSTSRTPPGWCGRRRPPAWCRTTTTRPCWPSACSARSPSSRTTTAPVGSTISIDELARFVGQWTIQALAAVPSPAAG